MACNRRQYTAADRRRCRRYYDTELAPVVAPAWLSVQLRFYRY